ncbi:MAG: hypothetical protein JWP81_5027 [Ferruginibacter sp.]|nr:hypothetical protein [Ferruginibacter sp.]
MSHPVAKSINVFITSDRLIANNYFNRHDPAPIYMRQLSHQFEDYISQSVKSAKRHSAIFYKLKCKCEDDKQYAEPLMYAIRGHFTAKKEDREKEFVKFKRRNWTLLVISIIVVILFQTMLPMVMSSESGFTTGVINSLDVFAWVLLWHPIDELVFRWNTFLKDICLLKKLATAEYILIENEKNYVVVDDSLRVVA